MLDCTFNRRGARSTKKSRGKKIQPLPLTYVKHESEAQTKGNAKRRDQTKDDTTKYISTSDLGQSAPNPRGALRKDIGRQKNPSEKKLAASKMLDFMTAASPASYNSINSTTTPVPLLIHVPGTNKVRFILGLSVYCGNPFDTTHSALEGSFVAIQQDITDPGDTPTVALLPKDVIKFNVVPVPPTRDYKTEVAKNMDTGKLSFKDSKCTNSANLPKAILFPAHWAYDAFNQDVPTKILWEQVKAYPDPQATSILTLAEKFSVLLTQNTAPTTKQQSSRQTRSCKCPQGR